MRMSSRSIHVATTMALITGALGVSGAVAAPASLTSDVALFLDEEYVETGMDCGDEATNVQISLAAGGHRIAAIGDPSAATFQTALEDAQALVVPEQEPGDLTPALSEDARQVIRGFVAGGGRFIVHGALTEAAALINALFGFSVVEEAGDDSPWARTSEAAGTPFAAGPASLPENNSMRVLTTTSLPAGSANVYSNAGETVVGVMPYGAGSVTYLGWDWFNSDPGNNPTGCDGGQDGGWQSILDLAVSMLPGRCTNLRVGTGANDTLEGSGAGDTLKGKEGKDRLPGEGGDDCLAGGPDNDKLRGHDGKDRLRGGPGDDRLNGGDDKNRYSGGAGDDRIKAANGIKEKVKCGSGDDRARVDQVDTTAGCEDVTTV